MNRVLFTTQNRTGVIELNRPEALNSLSPDMIEAIMAQLDDWAADDAVEQVLIHSRHPKAFCAGGDVRLARDRVLAGAPEDVDGFLHTEYDMNAQIAEFPKPYIAVLDGLAMGGGLGVSAHGSHRFVTERSWASMPEMNIGLINDVGIGFMAQRMVGARGVASPALAKFWGITGYRMTAADMLYTGLATGLIPDGVSGEEFVADVIERGVDAVAVGDPTTLGPAPLAGYIDDIEVAFAHRDWEDILAACSPGLRELVDELTAQASPTAIAAGLALFDFHEHAPDLRAAAAAEKRLSSFMIRHPDFVEGIRAVLVDKTQDAQFATTIDYEGIEAALMHL